jgi:hypothetical protein
VEEERKLINKKWKRLKNITCGGPDVRASASLKCVSEEERTNEPTRPGFGSNL